MEAMYSAKESASSETTTSKTPSAPNGTAKENALLAPSEQSGRKENAKSSVTNVKPGMEELQPAHPVTEDTSSAKENVK